MSQNSHVHPIAGCAICACADRPVHSCAVAAHERVRWAREPMALPAPNKQGRIVIEQTGRYFAPMKLTVRS